MHNNEELRLVIFDIVPETNDGRTKLSELPTFTCITIALDGGVLCSSDSVDTR